MSVQESNQKSKLLKKYVSYFIMANVFVSLIYIKSVFFGFFTAALVYGVFLVLILRHKFKRRAIENIPKS